MISPFPVARVEGPNSWPPNIPLSRFGSPRVLLAHSHRQLVSSVCYIPCVRISFIRRSWRELNGDDLRPARKATLEMILRKPGWALDSPYGLFVPDVP